MKSKSSKMLLHFCLFGFGVWGFCFKTVLLLCRPEQPQARDLFPPTSQALGLWLLEGSLRPNRGWKGGCVNKA